MVTYILLNDYQLVLLYRHMFMSLLAPFGLVVNQLHKFKVSTSLLDPLFIQDITWLLFGCYFVIKL